MTAMKIMLLAFLLQGSGADVDYQKDIRPIFEAKCFKCHGPKKQKGDLRLDSPQAILAGSEDGKVIVPGKPDQSKLIKLISLPADRDDIMPAKGDPLTPEQIELFRKWIAADAPFGEAAPPKPRVLKKVPPADPTALKKLREAGALALPVAEGTNLLSVSFRGLGPRTSDAQLALLRPLAVQVMELNLARAKITETGLGHLAVLKNLETLHLERSDVGDAGLSQLATLTELRYLNLYGTAVTDAGLKYLAGLKKLRKLYLWKTKVTDAGAAELKKALPDVAINRGEKLTASIPKSSINGVCPVAGRGVVPSATFTYKGKVIGFCCGDCLAKFSKEPEKFIGKVKEFKAPAKPINTVCPITGKGIDPTKTFVYKKQLIGFCCGDCLAKFSATPEKFVSKVKEFKQK